MNDSISLHDSSLSSHNSPPPPHRRTNTAEPTPRPDRSSPLLTRRQQPLGNLSLDPSFDQHSETVDDGRSPESDLPLHGSFGEPNAAAVGLAAPLQRPSNSILLAPAPSGKKSQQQMQRSKSPPPQQSSLGLSSQQPSSAAKPLMNVAKQQSSSFNQQQRTRAIDPLDLSQDASIASTINNRGGAIGGGSFDDDRSQGTIVLHDESVRSSSQAHVGPAWRHMVAPAEDGTTDTATTPLRNASGGSGSVNQPRFGAPPPLPGSSNHRPPVAIASHSLSLSSSRHPSSGGGLAQIPQRASVNGGGGGGGLPGARPSGHRRGGSVCVRFDVSTQVSFNPPPAVSQGGVLSSQMNSQNSSGANAKELGAALPSAQNGGASSGTDAATTEMFKGLLDEAEEEVEMLEGKNEALKRELDWYKEELGNREALLEAFRSEQKQQSQAIRQRDQEIAALKKQLAASSPSKLSTGSSKQGSGSFPPPAVPATTTSQADPATTKAQAVPQQPGSSRSTTGGGGQPPVVAGHTTRVSFGGSTNLEESNESPPSEGNATQDQDPPIWWAMALDDIRQVVQQELAAGQHLGKKR